MNKTNIYFQGLSNQEESLTAIREVWTGTEKDIAETFIGVLGCDITKFREIIDVLPDYWLQYMKDCAVAGLRQALLENYEIEQ